jgi:hypothetical protein
MLRFSVKIPNNPKEYFKEYDKRAIKTNIFDTEKGKTIVLTHKEEKLIFNIVDTENGKTITVTDKNGTQTVNTGTSLPITTIIFAYEKEIIAEVPLPDENITPETNPELTEAGSDMTTLLRKLTDIETAIKNTGNTPQQCKPTLDYNSLQQIKQIYDEMLKEVNSNLKWTLQLLSLPVPEGDDKIEEMFLQIGNYKFLPNPEQDEKQQKAEMKKLEVIANNVKTATDIIKSATEKIRRFQV